MFDYTPVGITVLLAGTAFMALMGRRLLPRRDPVGEFSSARARDFKSLYELHDRIVLLHLPKGSILDGKTLAENRLGAVLGLNVVAVSASAAFLSPVEHSANVLVMGPGGYRFSDYLKVGIPLTFVVLAVVVLIMPVFWPF